MYSYETCIVNSLISYSTLDIYIWCIFESVFHWLIEPRWQRR